MSRPGVFVTETVLPTPVVSDPPATAAGCILAELPAGPSTPTLVTSWYAFTRIFGGLNRAYPATFSANMFFRAGGRSLFVNRIVRDDADAASGSILGDGSDADTNLDDIYLTFTAKSVGSYGNSLRVTVTENASSLYDVRVYQESGVAGDITDDTLLETFSNLDVATRGNTEIVDAINVQSQFIDVAWGSDTTVTIPTNIPTITLSGGTDGTTEGILDYEAALDAMATRNRSLVMFAPGNIDEDVIGAMIAYAEANRSFVVLDTPENLPPSVAVTYANGLASTSFAAMYYPWLWVPDSTSKSRSAIIKVAPSGAVAGAYLATDASTGVFKAPAGIQATIPNVVAVERSLTNDDLDALNNDTKPVNALRVMPGVGTAIMGARTLDQAASTRYVNIRRTLQFLSREMESSLQFALFRNNDTALWREIRTVLDNFLRGFLGQGGLRGTSPSTAYYIKVDGENNTAADVANGIVNVEVGVALQYPAEFIKIKLTQRTQA